MEVTVGDAVGLLASPAVVGAAVSSGNDPEDPAGFCVGALEGIDDGSGVGRGLPPVLFGSLSPISSVPYPASGTRSELTCEYSQSW